MKIKLTQPNNAPSFCFELVPVDDHGDDIDGINPVFIQSDWDYPSIASTFGWQACWCGFTDGTVDCRHKRASDMIADASDFLAAHDGEVMEDPGYFNEEATP